MIYLTNYVFKKTEDLNIHIFNMITGINEPKILIKHISWKCKCKFDGRKFKTHIKSGITSVSVKVKIK